MSKEEFIDAFNKVHNDFYVNGNPITIHDKDLFSRDLYAKLGQINIEKITPPLTHEQRISAINCLTEVVNTYRDMVGDEIQNIFSEATLKLEELVKGIEV